MEQEKAKSEIRSIEINTPSDTLREVAEQLLKQSDTETLSHRGSGSKEIYIVKCPSVESRDMEVRSTAEVTEVRPGVFKVDQYLDFPSGLTLEEFAEFYA